MHKTIRVSGQLGLSPTINAFASESMHDTCSRGGQILADREQRCQRVPARRQHAHKGKSAKNSKDEGLGTEPTYESDTGRAGDPGMRQGVVSVYAPWLWHCNLKQPPAAAFWRLRWCVGNAFAVWVRKRKVAPHYHTSLPASESLSLAPRPSCRAWDKWCSSPDAGGRMIVRRKVENTQGCAAPRNSYIGLSWLRAPSVSPRALGVKKPASSFGFVVAICDGSAIARLPFGDTFPPWMSIAPRGWVSGQFAGSKRLSGWQA